MRALELTLLVHDGPIARAYASRLRRDGACPARILVMTPGRRGRTGRPLGRWLPRALRLQYAERMHALAQNYWPTQLRRSHPRLVQTMTEALGEICPGASALVEGMAGRVRWEEYGQRVDRVLVDGLGDPALSRALALGPPTVLFTGGGLVPPGLLHLPGVRFLHVHPGLLPQVRGADGLLWSTLVRGRPGATCFWLAEAIDTGPIVFAEEFPPLAAPLGAASRPDDETLYRAIFSFWDPLLRADCLARAVDAGALEPGWPARPQPSSIGVTYHFMHPALRRAALARLFPERRTAAPAMAASCGAVP
jgi:hypothetical protein